MNWRIPLWLAAAMLAALAFLTGILAGYQIFGVEGWILRSSEMHKQFDQMTAIADERQKQVEECNAKFSKATVLYELEPGKGLQVLGGLVELRPGKALGGKDALAHSGVRWYIPAKIKPLVYGDGKGFAYGYFDPQANKIEGPFAPETVPR